MTECIRIVEDGPEWVLFHQDAEVLRYRHGPSGVPDGVNPVFERVGGYLHPVRSPGGAVLTRIQPPDHYHHYAVWNPWTQTEIEGRTVDFWNLKKEQGTVRSTGIIETNAGEDTGGFRVGLEHIDKTGPEGPRPVLQEEWHVEARRRTGDGAVQLVDFISRISPCAGIPVRVKAYRYQGFTFRGRADWDETNLELVTSAGKGQADANGTPAHWVLIDGPTEVAAGRSGILFLSHPENPGHPEELRIWPVGANKGKENAFVNFNPAQTRDLPFHPGTTYTFRYRLLLHDGKRDAQWADEQWRAYQEQCAC